MNLLLIPLGFIAFVALRFLIIRYTFRKHTKAMFAITMSFASEETREDLLNQHCSNQAVLRKALRVFV